MMIIKTRQRFGFVFYFCIGSLHYDPVFYIILLTFALNLKLSFGQDTYTRQTYVSLRDKKKIENIMENQLKKLHFFLLSMLMLIPIFAVSGVILCCIRICKNCLHYLKYTPT